MIVDVKVELIDVPLLGVAMTKGLEDVLLWLDGPFEGVVYVLGVP